MKSIGKGILMALMLVLSVLWFRSTGLCMLAVTSGSMEPALPVGSAVFILPCPYEGITGGDVVTFQLGESLVTHRVVDRVEGGLITKGDANKKEDAGVVRAEQVKGRVAFCIPFLGRLLLLFQGEGRRLAFLYLGFWMLVVLFWEDKHRREKDLKHGE